MIITIFILVFLGSVQIVSAQNLIPNPSYEDILTCCEREGRCSPVAWRRVVNDGVNFGISNRKNPAADGNIFVTIVMADADKRNYRTYIQAPLLCELKAGETYHFQMYVRANRFAVNHIGVFFSDSLFCTEPPPFTQPIIHENTLLKLNPQLNFRNDKKLVHNRRKWKMVAAPYTAKGGEKYLIIGGFIDDDELVWKRVMPKRKISVSRSEYDIDKVSLVPENLNALCDFRQNEIEITADRWRHSCNTSPNCVPSKVIAPKAVVLKNVFFEKSKWELLPGSKTELDYWVNKLLNTPFKTVTISGHTDNFGSTESNNLLSYNRAKAVAEYLVQNGIPAEKIKVEGFGCEFPLATNETPEGRAMNRRVEILIQE